VTVEKHDLQVGDKVVFEEVEGFDEEEQYKVQKVVNPTTFIVSATLSESFSLRGGRFLQVKETVQVGGEDSVWSALCHANGYIVVQSIFAIFCPVLLSGVISPSVTCPREATDDPHRFLQGGSREGIDIACLLP